MLALPTLDMPRCWGGIRPQRIKRHLWLRQPRRPSRPFNMIRAKLHELRTERGWRLFGVVSATPKVGKSFIAANVAASLSRDPRFRTMVIDLDLRRASLTGIFNIDPKLASALTSRRSVSDIRRACARRRTAGGPSHDVWAYSFGRAAPRPRAQALFQAMRAAEDTDLFIVDLPPVFANDDAVRALERLNGYVVVVEEGRTTTREVKDVVSLLGLDRLAGVILNKYRGGMVSEGYGVDNYYAAGYYSGARGSEEA